MSNRNIVKIIENHCKNNSITLTKLSADWILKLTKNNESHYVIGFQFELNSSAAREICLDKAATSEILTINEIPTVKHKLFMHNESENGNWEKMINYLKNHKKIVCKVNNGTGGRDVYLVDNVKSLEKAVNKIFSKKQYLTLSPFYDIKNEYRTIILNNEVKLVYSKVRPYIVGDGTSSILKLIGENFSNLDKIDLTDIKLNKILEKNEKYFLSWKHNLGLGSSSKILTDEKKIDEITKLALKAANAVNGKFVSVDIIETESELKVLEINSGIMMENFSSESPEKYKIAENIYGEAINLMFSMKGEI